MNELVFMKNEEPLTDSVRVSEMFEKEHAKVMRNIDSILETLAKNGERLKGEKMFIASRRKAADGQFHRMYYMNRDGFSLLAMGFTGARAMQWKLKYIEAFNAMEKVVMEKQTADWLETRRQGKLIRREETDVIQQLVEYAKNQGSEHSQMLYMTYTKLANRIVGVSNRDSATHAQLNDLSTMERLIAKVVLDGMDAGTHYKQIYKDCKERLETVKNWLVA